MTPLWLVSLCLLQAEPAPTFRTGTNLVSLTVVVRDNSGQAVGHLHRQDFQLFDRGKAQEITRFSVEGSARAGLPGQNGASDVPKRFVTLLFDDLHLSFLDVPAVRKAALQRVAAMPPEDRMAIYTTSGRLSLDFSSDRDALRQALDRLRAYADADDLRCFTLGYYWADLVDKSEPQAVEAAKKLAKSCDMPTQDVVIKADARVQMMEGMLRAQTALAMLRNVVRLMARAPGERSIILISPGFYAPHERFPWSEIFSEAAQANVLVHCLNALGLVAPVSNDLGSAGRNFHRERQILSDGTLAQIAESTGGKYFHNDNGLGAGLEQLAAAPEFHYVLAFTPLDLKLDGKFHPLKVTLVNGRGLSVTARRGYYASRAMASPEEAAKQEIHEALYSNARIGGLPFELRTTSGPSVDGKITLEVSAWMDPRELRMHEEGGVHRKPLTVVFGLFDMDGNVKVTTQKDVGLQIRDSDLQRITGHWVPVKASFPVKPGKYSVRVVVRDSEEQLLSTHDATVEAGEGIH